MAPTDSMKARKPSRVVKPKKNAGRTTSLSKNHRFRSFSERIAKLNIDPIRQRRYVEKQEELSESTATYFGKSFEEWRDLNLSQTFTAFARDAAPLCDNLPVVLHNEARIMDLLATYIEKGDGLALEPLLSLLSHFAHDLDTRFEKHFPRAVSIVTAVAAKHADPAVIEWSFNCLAWLFKYLSRLLAPDLRPLYDLMSPYLGKEVRRTFIIRFAAESLSFLLRKAAATYERDAGPLKIIISHILEDCGSESSGDLHRQGVMTLLTEAIKGVQNGIHSSGLAVLQSILKQTGEQRDENGKAISQILTGMLTSLIHHTNSETFKPIQDCVVDYINSGSPHAASFGSTILFTIVTVRKGTRVSEWRQVVHTIQSLVDQSQVSLDLDAATRSSVLHTLAVLFQTATIDILLGALSSLEAIRGGQWASYFLQFCDLFARLGTERFENFLMPQLQKFVFEQWEGNEDAILSSLPNLASQNLAIKLTCPEGLQDVLVQRVEDLAAESETAARLERLVSATAALMGIPYLKLKKRKQQELSATLQLFVERRLIAEDGESMALDNFVLGTCLSGLLDSVDSSVSISDLWPTLCNESSRFVNLSKFWSNLLRYMEICPPATSLLEGSHMASLRKSLLRCVSMPSHSIRQTALEITQLICKLKDEPVPEVLLSAIAIESTPTSLETSRSISMNIRRLASGYGDSALDEQMQKAIPSYCFGILHFQLSQAWSDAINALAEMSKTPVGEDVIISLAQNWLESSQTREDKHEGSQSRLPLNVESTGFQVASDFECSNSAKVSAICQQVFESSQSGYLSGHEHVSIKHAPVPTISPNAREQALRVLNRVPNVAEKRSRILVPVLLRWAGNAFAELDEIEEDVMSRWNRKDQKAMLSVFAQFNNPKVLFRSAEVYEALLNLCANGDVEIQRSAFKAILAWKDPAVSNYEERLNNILDEYRFREEISVFLQDNSDSETALRPEHHPKLMPILLRLLYGRAVAGGKHEQSSRRKAIFIALSRFDENVLGSFIDIALGSASNTQLLGEDKFNEQSLTQLQMPPRVQLGMLNMLDGILETLGGALEPFAGKLMNTVLLCAVAATRTIDHSSRNEDLHNASLLRSIRHTGIQCLVKIFSTMTNPAFDIHAKVIMHELVAPRLEKLAKENAQSVSGILRLISAWSGSPKTVRYVIDFREDLLDRTSDLLREPNAKDEVRLFVLQSILDNLLVEGVNAGLIEPYATSFVQGIGDVLNQQPSKNVIDACVASFTRLSVHIHNAEEAANVLHVCTGLLIKPNKAVSSRTKTGLLETILPLVETFELPLESQLFDALCGLFSRLYDNESRVLLSSVLKEICKSDPQLAESARISEDLNALGGKLDEVDHERREAGFMKIYQQYETLSVQQWKPIVQNCLFYIRDADDLVNRSSSSQALERFIDAACHSTEDFKALVAETILPGIEYGMKSKYELVRAEYLRLLGHLVERFPEWPAVNDMKSLTAGGDDDASVFTNLLHIQQHRRLRALRRLSDEASKVKSSNATKLFVPLLEHFVFDPAEGDPGRALADQAVSTIGAIAVVLKWSAFRATFRRYSLYLTSGEEYGKVVLRLLGVLVDALRDSSDASDETPRIQITVDRSEIIKRDCLPSLTDYVHHKDESTVDRRMPAAVTIVKLLLLLPELEMSSRLAPLLSDVCHVLRSRSQEARDQTRKSLAAILGLVGPSYLGFILKELRGALQRGYQLHVLSFTVHSLLVNAIDTCKPGDLNECLRELTTIIMDDIFGVTGQEKDAEEYKTGMKEVKNSKSFDTMEILAKITPIPRLGHLIRPIIPLLSEKLDSRSLKKIDDLLSRIRKGIDQNPASDSRDMLIFCHEIMQQVHGEQTSITVNTKQVDYKFRKHLIQMDPSEKSKSKSATTSHVFKLVSFALNLVRKVIRRHEDLMTPANMRGFLPMAGDALVEGREEVQLSAIKLLSTTIKLPIPELDTNVPVYVKEAVRLVKAAPSMTTDSAKAALELIIAVLRDKRAINISDRDVADVLKGLKSSIDEPDRQGIIYKFLRAVVSRKIMVTEVYELMDEVGKVLVTNPDHNVRESARSVYLQFILEYPQGKEKWNKQAVFFVENLKYEQPAGRQSVMELLHQLLSKLQDEVVARLAFTIFVSLVPVHVGDSDHACQQMAGLLLGMLSKRANEEQTNKFLDLMEKWLQDGTNQAIQVAALKCWMIFLRTDAPSGKRIEKLRDTLKDLLDSGTESNSGSELALDCLRTFEILVGTTPNIALDKSSAGIWEGVKTCLISSHIETQEIAARLLGTYFSSLASICAKTSTGLSAVPLQAFGGLELGATDMRHTCSASLRVLRSTAGVLGDTLAAQTARNLVFLGRCFAASGLTWQTEAELASDEEDIYGVDAAPGRSSSAIGYLFNRLSYIIRQDNLSITSRVAAVRCQSALINQVQTIPALQTLLRPLYLLTDPSVPQPTGEAHKDLTDNARQLLDNIQRKVGANAFVSALGAVRSDAKAKREDRRQKRRIDAVSAPERWAREKRKKHETKKAKIKSKGMEAGSRRRGW